eukprot:9103637-Alexandrium_andersonii.AAC.1
MVPPALGKRHLLGARRWDRCPAGRAGEGLAASAAPLPEARRRRLLRKCPVLLAWDSQQHCARFGQRRRNIFRWSAAHAELVFAF